MPPTQNSVYRAKKARKCVFLTAGLRKIIRLKNKKTPNNVRFLFYMHIIAENSTAYAKFGKNPKKDQNWTPRATGLSLYDKYTTNRCVFRSATFFICIMLIKKVPPTHNFHF